MAIPALLWLAAVPAQAKPQQPLKAGLVEVTSPSAGAVLVAGEELLLAWRPVDPAAASFEEWEAFLSLDGGATYPVRLSPHLDADVRAFAVQLPEVATADAHLLLRFGDGEVEWELPLPFALEIEPALLPPEPACRIARGTGEAARPGLPGVTSWLEGSGRGRDLVEVVVAQQDLASRLAPWVVPAGLELAAERPVPAELPRVAEGVRRLAVETHLLPPSPPPSGLLDPRLATCRFNE
ncbi:MAG TPA: hypothetical protein VF017_22620 [Thermoanaerobaculia bacterium]|nr:hypothetical protein [Thermoanaerobaculia bacterium]